MFYLERFSTRRTFGALMVAGGLALLLVLGMTSSAMAGNDKPKDDKDPYTSTTVTTLPTTTTVPGSTTTVPDPSTTVPVTVERTRLTRSTDPGQTLPVTGSDVMGLTLLGMGVLAVGGGLVWYSRRSQADGADVS